MKNKHIKVWRDVDNNRRHFGIVISSWGGELCLGRRMYHWTWR